VTEGATSTRAVLHPLVLGALALLILNDHVLKAAYPGWWTGKLSDVAGLAMFPILVSGGGQLLGIWPGGARTVAVVAVATGVAFTACKVWAPAGDVYRVGLAALQWPAHAIAALLEGDTLPGVGRVRLTPDPTDLIALPAVWMWQLVGCDPRIADTHGTAGGGWLSA
jgi:hypothetical protein